MLAALLVSVLTPSVYGLPAEPGTATDGQVEERRFGAFGILSLYRPAGIPKSVVIFASGDGGWNKGVVDMAKLLVAEGAVVAGFDSSHYMANLRQREGSVDLATDFDALAKDLEGSLHLGEWRPPVLVGYSSGATLVYACLVQAPPGTFAGAISLGFSPRLAVAKEFYKGYGLSGKPYETKEEKGIAFEPAAGLRSPWVMLQGAIDEVVDPRSAATFAKAVKDTTFVLLPEVGHGFSVTSRWAPAFIAGYKDILAAIPQPAVGADTKGLPLIELPAAAGQAGDYFVVLLSGDGGWVNIDRSVAEYLNGKGVPVVGFDSLAYFWNPKDPDILAADLARIIGHYAEAWGRSRVLLMGYSLGADVLPFALRRLPPSASSMVLGMALIAPSNNASFQFHLSDWVGTTTDRRWPVLPEIEALAGREILVVSGADETDTPAKKLDSTLFLLRRLPGGHHFSGDFTAIAKVILETWPR